MERPRETGERRVRDLFDAREAPIFRREPIEAVVPERTCGASWRGIDSRGVEEVVVKRHVREIPADGTEGVHVGMALLEPVDELDAELEGALRMTQEIVLVDLEQLVEARDRGDRRLTDPDDADLRGLDECDREPRPEHAREGGGRHPSG